MTNQLYSSSRFVTEENGEYESIKAEMSVFFKEAKKLIDAKFDTAENYKFDRGGFKILEADSEPFRMIECNHLIEKNGIVVGTVTLRGTNQRPKHDINFLQDVLEREYELRFKTWAGCDFSVESSGIAFTQFGDGPIMVNSCSVSGFHVTILRKHWDEFKSNCTFTAADLDKPTKSFKWTKRKDRFART